MRNLLGHTTVDLLSGRSQVRILPGALRLTSGNASRHGMLGSTGSRFGRETVRFLISDVDRVTAAYRAFSARPVTSWMPLAPSR